jgi:hypothetical protein
MKREKPRKPNPFRRFESFGEYAAMCMANALRAPRFRPSDRAAEGVSPLRASIAFRKGGDA